MEITFEKVPASGITAEVVLNLWQQGELYVKKIKKVETPEETIERCRQEALAYVQRVDSYTTSFWLPYIKRLWETILSNEAILTSLTIKKGRNRNQLNRYFITAIVVLLREKGLYRQDIPALKLHLIMENVEKKSVIYASYSQYAPENKQRKMLVEIINSLKMGI